MPCSGVLYAFYRKFTVLWITKEGLFRNTESQISNSKIYQKKEKFKLSSPQVVIAISRCRLLFIHRQEDWIRVTLTRLGQNIKLATTGDYILGNICNFFSQKIKESYRIPLNLGSKATDYFAKSHLCYLRPFFPYSLYQS